MRCKVPISWSVDSDGFETPVFSTETNATMLAGDSSGCVAILDNDDYPKVYEWENIRLLPQMSPAGGDPK